MKNVDLHNHTEFSFDSVMTIEEAIEAAKKYDLVFGIAEHYDSNDKRADRVMDFDRDEYFKAYTKYRQQGDVLLGIEIGMDTRDEYVSASRKAALNYPFDVVIGSAHKIEGKSIGPLLKERPMNKEQFHTTYLLDVVKQLEANKYIDVFAHIDYPTRYTKFSVNETYYEEFPELYDMVFDKLIELNIALEINNRMLSYTNFYNALLSVVKGYVKRGGKYVTIASDAHSPKDVGIRYHLSRNLAEEAGAQVVYFKNRQRTLD